MIKTKQTDKICIVIVAITIVIAMICMNYESFGISIAQTSLPYVSKIFDDSVVHEIDIVVDKDDWAEMLENAAAEEYINVTLVIDGEAYKNVAIRPKGNSSLTQVASSDSDRYSFKVEFDHYDNNISYYGLDKLALNNIIQDSTYLKDYLCYKMMAFNGAESPLCSFTWITVNGEDWGLYLAAEGIEDAFAQRNYGSDYGDIYKPESMNMGGGGGGDMSSDSVALLYSDDDYDSYSAIFDYSVFDITDEDKDDLIAALKRLNEGDIENSVDIDEVIRYFVVHNFVLNGDSYTGSILHNYYLREDDGLLSMIAWDYNLAFGGMTMGSRGGADNAASTVNSPIDSPVTSGDISERPMVSWIFESEEYTKIYHEIFAEFIAGFFDSGYFTDLITSAIDIISPYVEKDPTAFCTYDEFLTGTATLVEFCNLRAESVSLQLDGTIPSTSDGQAADSSSFVDASNINISDMGSNNMGGGNRGEFSDITARFDTSASTDTTVDSVDAMTYDSANADSDAAAVAAAGEMSDMANGETPPEMPSGDFTPPDMANGETLPEMPSGDFTPPDMANGAATENNASPALPDSEADADGAAVDGTATTDDTNAQAGNFAQGGFGGGNRGGMMGGDMQNMPSEQNAQTNSTEYIILFAGSIVLLVGGIIFAKLFRR